MRTRNSTSAGAIRFSAVPPMVWSARRLMAAKASNSEKIEPISAAANIARNISPCRPQKLPAAFAASNTGVT